MRNKLFSTLLIVLFILGAGLFVLPQKDSSIQENRPLKTSSSLTLDEGLLSSIEDVMKDQFYLRDLLTKTYKRIELFFCRPLSHVVINSYDMNYLDEDVIELSDKYLINSLIEYNDDNRQSAASRGYNVNEVALRYPDLKTYVYFPTRFEEVINGEAEFQTNFSWQLNENIRTDSLKLYCLDDHKNYYYKTDMHWNNRGAYQGYADIINMIRLDFELEEVREPIEEIVYPYEFCGNVASQIAGLSDADHIADYVFDLGNFDYYLNGELVSFNAAKEAYAQSGNTSHFSDYEYYFGDNAYLRVFDFHKEDKPNLLIFCDSYINTNMSWIASHFNKTVLVDLRARDDGFDLDELIRDYDIDILLVTMRYTNLYYNGNMFIPID